MKTKEFKDVHRGNVYICMFTLLFQAFNTYLNNDNCKYSKWEQEFLFKGVVALTQNTNNSFVLLWIIKATVAGRYFFSLFNCEFLV